MRKEKRQDGNEGVFRNGYGLFWTRQNGAWILRTLNSRSVEKARIRTAQAGEDFRSTSRNLLDSMSKKHGRRRRFWGRRSLICPSLDKEWGTRVRFGCSQGYAVRWTNSESTLRAWIRVLLTGDEALRDDVPGRQRRPKTVKGMHKGCSTSCGQWFSA